MRAIYHCATHPLDGLFPQFWSSPNVGPLLEEKVVLSALHKESIYCCTVFEIFCSNCPFSWWLLQLLQIIIYVIALSLSSTLTISCNIFVSSRNISILSIFHGSLISKRSWFFWFHHLLGQITVLSANYFSFHRKTQHFSFQMSKHSGFSSHNFPTTVILRTCFL